MAVKFSPNGFLDVSTDPSELPSQGSNGDEVSGEMTRCTNLHLDRMGIASTRKGSSKVNSSAISSATIPYLILEQAGKRYLFCDSSIYEDEVSIKTSLSSQMWSGIKYNPFNSLRQDIYALNGSDRKRIEDGAVYEWGIEAPVDLPVIETGSGTGLTGTYNVKYTYCRKEGNTVVYESNPSEPAAANVILSNGSLTIKIEKIDDPQITAIRVYRTESTGTDYYFLREIDVTTYSVYAYCYDWEKTDAYISGTGFQITSSVSYTSELEIDDCEAVSDSGGTWAKVSGSGSVSLNANPSYIKKGSGSIRMNATWLSPYGYLKSDLTVRYTKGIGSWDLSACDRLNFWIYCPNAVNLVYLYFGESDYNEQTSGSFSLSAGWTLKTWDISAITSTDKDAVTKIGIRHDNHDGTNYYLYVDDIYADVASYEHEGVRKLFSWEPDALTDAESAISTHFWEFVITDDATADTALGTEPEDNHNRPPIGTFVFGPTFTGMCFICYQNLLYYCLEKRPEYWPLTYYLEVSTTDFYLKAGCIHDGQPYVATTEEIYLIQGTSHSTFSPPLSMSAITGTISQNCFLPVHGHGIFHLGNDGIYLHSGAKDENITNSRFKPIFNGTTVGSLPGVDKTNLKNSWMICFNNKLYFGYPKLGSTYPDNIIVTDLATGRSVHYDYGRTFPSIGIDYTNDRILAVDTVGYVWEIEDADVTTDDGTAISWQIESKAYSDQLRKYFPRWARYDITIGTGATANGFILLNDTSKQTHALTVSRKTKKRLITGCTGDRIAIRLTGTGPVDFFNCEVD